MRLILPVNIAILLRLAQFSRVTPQIFVKITRAKEGGGEFLAEHARNSRGALTKVGGVSLSFVLFVCVCKTCLVSMTLRLVRNRIRGVLIFPGLNNSHTNGRSREGGPLPSFPGLILISRPVSRKLNHCAVDENDGSLCRKSGAEFSPSCIARESLNDILDVIDVVFFRLDISWMCARDGNFVIDDTNRVREILLRDCRTADDGELQSTIVCVGSKNISELMHSAASRTSE